MSDEISLVEAFEEACRLLGERRVLDSLIDRRQEPVAEDVPEATDY